MAISWLTVLQNVPWSEVISNAPKVVDGAKALWKAVARKPAESEISVPDTEAPMSPEGRAIVALEARVASLEANVSDLHAQMLASSELINALAEQNTQLIQRIEANRIKTFRLSIACAAIAVIAAVALGFSLVQPEI